MIYPNQYTKNDTLKEKAYKIIKDKIARCELAPGEILNEKSLIEEIGASRTPIREALSRIEQENLVRIIPKRGVFVSEITMKDISEIYQVREELDPFITKLATPYVPEKELLRYQQLFSQIDSLKYSESIEIDDQFHSLILMSCNNSYLIQMMNNIYVQNQRIRVLSARLNNRIKVSANEHLDIISNLLKRDADKAAEAMRKHIVSSKNVAFQIIQVF